MLHEHCWAGANARHVAVGVVALSTDVPSPHSLNVVTKCQWVVVDATMAATSVVYLVVSLASLGPASPAFQKPALTLKLEFPVWLEWTSGLYWCQSSGCTAQLADPAATFRITYATLPAAAFASCHRCATGQGSASVLYTKMTKRPPIFSQAGSAA